MALREVFFYKVKEDLANICLHSFRKWGVEVSYVALPIFGFLTVGGGLKMKGKVIPTLI